MGGRGKVLFDEKFISRALAGTDELIAPGVSQETDWHKIARHMASILPGSAVSITNYDLPLRHVRQAVQFGLDPEMVRSYVDHYSYLNPWLNYWDRAPEGAVKLSEREYPVTLFQDTEFYNEWVAPQEAMSAAAGMKIVAAGREVVHVNWHYPRRLAPVYDTPASTLLDGIKHHIASAVELAEAFRGAGEAGLRRGALVERLDAMAFLLAADRQVIDANDWAVWAMRNAGLVSNTGNLLAFNHPAAQRWLDVCMHGLAFGQAPSNGNLVVAWEDKVLRFSATIVPERAGGAGGLLLAPRRFLLIIVKPLLGDAVQLDGHVLRQAFQLSASEVRLCEMLVNGHSLQEASRISGVSEGTIRQRVKAVFHKTRTNRQGQLVAMLARMSVMRAGP